MPSNEVAYIYFSPSHDGIFKGTLLIGVGILNRDKVHIKEEGKSTFSLAHEDKHILTLYRVEDAEHLKRIIWHGSRSLIRFPPSYFVPINDKASTETYKLSIIDYINAKFVESSYVSLLLKSRGIDNLDVNTLTEFVISPGRFCHERNLTTTFDDLESLLAILALTLPSPKGADALSYWTYRWNLV